MKLEEKGKIIPPPALSKYSEIVSKEIQKWKGIISATHWEIYDNNKPNGADFYFGEEELGHIHLDGMAHIVSTKILAAALIKAKLAQKFPYGANWVQFEINSKKTAEHAIWLFQLHYKKLNGTEEEKLINDILEYKNV